MIIRSKYVASDGSVANVPSWFTGRVWCEPMPIDAIDDLDPLELFACKEYERHDFAFPESVEESERMNAAVIMRSMQRRTINV